MSEDRFLRSGGSKRLEAKDVDCFIWNQGLLRELQFALAPFVEQCLKAFYGDDKWQLEALKVANARKNEGRLESLKDGDPRKLTSWEAIRKDSHKLLQQIQFNDAPFVDVLGKGSRAIAANLVSRRNEVSHNHEAAQRQTLSEISATSAFYDASLDLFDKIGHSPRPELQMGPRSALLHTLIAEARRETGGNLVAHSGDGELAVDQERRMAEAPHIDSANKVHIPSDADGSSSTSNPTGRSEFGSTITQRYESSPRAVLSHKSVRRPVMILGAIIGVSLAVIFIATGLKRRMNTAILPPSNTSQHPTPPSQPSTPPREGADPGRPPEARSTAPRGGSRGTAREVPRDANAEDGLTGSVTNARRPSEHLGHGPAAVHGFAFDLQRCFRATGRAWSVVCEFWITNHRPDRTFTVGNGIGAVEFTCWDNLGNEYSGKYIEVANRLMDARGVTLLSQTRTVAAFYIEGDVRGSTIARLSFSARASDTDAAFPVILKDLSISTGALPAPVAPIVTTTSHGFRYELEACTASGTTVRCMFVVTNQEGDRELTVIGSARNGSGAIGSARALNAGIPGTRAVDDSGNIATMREGGLANFGMFGGTFVSGVRTRLVVVLEGVSANAQSIAVLDLACGVGRDETFVIQFREIPLRR